MNYRKTKVLLLSFIAIFSLQSTFAQINTPRPSPNATIIQNIGLGDVKVEYSRPQTKGRKIYGDLVPFDKLWRTGANAPTKVTFTDTMNISGTRVVPGEYALYTIPGQSEWTVIFGKNASVQASDFKEEMAAAKFKVKPETLPSTVEAFTINFSNLTNKSADMEIQWEKTGVKFKIENEFDARVMADIAEKTSGVSPYTYFQAASYYYDSNRDMKKALEWVTKATEKNPKFWELHLKAKIQQKLNDCKGAIATAQQSADLAKKANNADYVKLNENLIAACGAKK